MKQLSSHRPTTPRQEIILRFIAHAGEASTRQLLKKLQKKYITSGGISRMTLIRDLNELTSRQFLTREGKGRAVYYTIRDKKRPSKEYLGIIPKELRTYFWDTDPRKLSLTRHATWIIERILEWGNPQAIRWLRQEYSDRELMHVLEKSRSISHKSWHFWKIMLINSHNPSPCTQKHWEQRQNTAWRR
jgi:hypothetical protein